MSFKILKKCRICFSKDFIRLLNLGNFAFTGKFPKSAEEKINISPLKLVMCNNCKLAQLGHVFKNTDLYNLNYGYESGINFTMKNHLYDIAKKICKIKKLNKNSIVMDIASNDGTLLNSYPKKIVKIGVDPIIKRFEKNYRNIDYKLNDFFSYESFLRLKIKKKIDVITAFAVFYDLDDPNKFLHDIKKILKEDGILLIEQSNVCKMIKLNSFDTICQEHCAYYSTKIIINLLKKNKLKIFNHEYNDSNGGSSRYYITHVENKNFKVNNNNINKALIFENSIKADTAEAYHGLEKKIKNIKKQCAFFFKNAHKKKYKVHGYGASTKGNVILQYFNITKKNIKFISERNSFKFNRYTPGTKIKIISEADSRKCRPNYYFVLPWHFKKEILSREILIRKKGTKFVFPLPNFHII